MYYLWWHQNHHTEKLLEFDSEVKFLLHVLVTGIPNLRSTYSKKKMNFVFYLYQREKPREVEEIPEEDRESC